MESTKAAPSATHDGSGFPDKSSRDMGRSDAVQLAEADMHRQPRIDLSKPLEEKYTWPQLVVTFVWIILILSVLAFGLKKAGVW